MTQEINYASWEKGFSVLILLITPVLISTQTVDSYLLPKYFWLAGLLLLWWLLIAVDPKSTRYKPSNLDYPLAALFLVSLVSILLHYRTFIQFRALSHLLMFLLLFYSFRRMWQWISVRVMVYVITIPALIISLYAHLQDYGVDFAQLSGGKGDWRFGIVATLGNPNFLAGYLAIVLPVIIAYTLRKITKTTWKTHIATGFFLLCILSITTCITVTFSVGAATGLLGAGVIGLITTLRIDKKVQMAWGRLFLVLFVIISSLAWYLLDNPYNSHRQSLYVEAKQSPAWYSGIGARKFNWKTTRLMINERPLTGIGFGNYLTVHEHYQGMNYEIQNHAHDRSWVVPVDQPHFQILETAAEVGPFGVFILFWLLLAWQRITYRQLKATHDEVWMSWGAYLGIWVAGIHSLSSFPFHLPVSSLMVVCLASYFVSYKKTHRVIKRKSIRWFKIALLIPLLLIAVDHYRQYYGSVHLRLGYEHRGMDALPFLTRAKQYDPYNPSIHHALGSQYANQGWHAKAKESLRRSIELQEDLDAHELLVEIHLRQKNLTKAIQAKKRVVELNPVYPGHHRDLAELLRKAEREEEAIKHEQRAEALESQLQD